MPLEQFELFENRANRFKAFVIVNYEHFDQQQFLKFVVRANSNLIIDLRLRSVFDQPKYDHVSILKYFEEKNIGYLQYPILEKMIKRRQSTFFEYSSYLKRYAREYDTSIIGVVDSGQKSRNNAQNLRTLFSRLQLPIVERLVSRALAG